jgi:hypothetical protein
MQSFNRSSLLPQFRFVSAQQKHAREEALEYFPCPAAGCGRFIEVEPKKCTFRIVEKAGGGFEAKLRVGYVRCDNLRVLRFEASSTYAF